MKRYDTMRSLLVYPQNGFAPPRGEKPGFGNCLFLLSPSRQKGYDLINSSFLNYRTGLYKHLMIDFIYREKIGYKKYAKNNTGAFKKEFAELDTTGSLRMVNNGNRATVLQSRRNLIVNLGEWFDLFLQNQIKSSTKKICYNFCKFLSEKVNSPVFQIENDLTPYRKIVYIDIDQWLSATNKLSFDRKDLVNPLAIMLVTLYKFPEYFDELNLKKVDYVFTTPSGSKIMKVSGEDLIKKKYSIFKQKLLSMVKSHLLDKSNLDEERILDEIPVPNKPKSEMTTNELISSIKNEKAVAQQKARDAILNNLTKNLLGNPEDLTEQDDGMEIETMDDEINEIRNMGMNYLDDHPELLDKDVEEVSTELTKEVRKEYYTREYEPKYTDEQLKRMQELAVIREEVIGDIDKIQDDPATKVIDKSDFSNVISTSNPNIEESKFVNFDRSYNKKKLMNDIHGMVYMLEKANPPIFVKGFKEEDSSTAMTYKKTLTYNLEDKDGNKMTLKFDIPIIFEDHFMMLNGSKKIIQHILILNPLVKTGKDTVQIVTNYQKMFIMLHGSVDLKTTSLLRYLTKNSTTYEVIGGNGIVTNKYYKSTMEYNGIARKIIQFRVNDALFILDGARIHELIENGTITPPPKMDWNTQFIIGIDKGKPIVMNIDESFVEKVYSYMEPDVIEDITKYADNANGGKLLQYATTKPLQKEIPLILLLYYFEGFETVMKKAEIEYELIPKNENGNYPDVDLYEWGLTEMEDGWIKWKRSPTENSFLMNGLNPLPMHLYSIHELNNKDTFIYLLTNYYSYANQTFNLDQYYDFMIDPITREILKDKKLPTNLVDLCILAVKMLKSEEFTPEGDLRNMRVRSNEIIAYHLYKKITDAYRTYRKTQHRKNPLPVSLARDAVIKDILSQPASAMNDASSLNPVLEISKLRAITYKGESGTNEEHAFKLGVRSYNETMLGVLGQTTSPDSGVGINRQLTLEPNITSTRGYIDVAGEKHVDELNGAQLLAPSDLLTPLGALHDDPTRTSMAYKQTMYMVLTDESDPVLIGNGVEKVLPYHLSSDFCINAEEDGKVVDETDEYTVVQYKSGKYRTIDKTAHVKKNSASGFYIKSQLTTDLKIGDKFKKNTIIAWDDKAFKKNPTDATASMRLGPIMKIAIVPEWDIYEDSAPMTYRAAEKMATNIVMPVTVTLNKDAYVSRIVNLGDRVNAGDTLILFDNYHDDPDVMAMIQARRQEEVEELVENYSTREESHYTGDVCDIEVITTVPVDELSESLQKIVKQHWKKLKRRDKILDKYSNEGDPKFYRSGNAIMTTPTPVKPDAQGKVKGKVVDDGVIITFYIAFRDILSKGDKFSSEFALKSTNSHIIADELAPYAESRPDEPIDMITAPLSISARKTPSIFIAMFGNKILIEEKRKLKEYWNNN